MPRGKSNQTAGILEYALSHLERERSEIETKIDHIRRQLGVSGAAPASTSAQTGAAAAAAPARKRRTLSAAARKRIAAAQKRRWAEHHKKMAAAG
jgi:hypothetical protein